MRRFDFSIGKCLALAGILAITSNAVFAHSLTVPFFRDDAPPLAGGAPTSGSAGFISVSNTTDTVVTMYVVYYQKNHNDEVIFQQASGFDLEPGRGISWRPIQSDPGEGAGQNVQNVLLGLGPRGSAEIIWLRDEGGPGALAGRYVEVTTVGTFAHVLRGG